MSLFDEEIEIEIAKRKPNTIWLTSLADLLALMLAFFVMVFSMSEIKKDTWEIVLEKLGYQLNDQVEASDKGPTADKNIELFSEQKAFDLAYLENILGSKIASSSELSDVEIFKSADRLIISFAGETYFGTGGDDVALKMVEATRLLGESLRYVKNRVEIYGHSDPSPMTGNDPDALTNWGLSLARALSVSDILKKSGYSFPIRVFGMADSRFFELEDVEDVQKKYALARRVDIVIREAEGLGR